MQDMFLTSAEVERLTGVHKGRDGKTRFELQAAHLLAQRIPFWQDAKGEPIVARAVIEGRQQQAEAQNEEWTPRALRATG